MSAKDWFIKAATMAIYCQAFEKLGDFYRAYVARQLAVYYTAEPCYGNFTSSIMRC
jgi:hypothetical protein